MKSLPRVLTIAGSDSGGGAGIQADLKAIIAHRCYGMTALTMVTAQNTQGVTAVASLTPLMVKEQIHAVVEDIGVDAIKIGVLHNAEIIAVVNEELRKIPEIPIVLDPVMVATSGDFLVDETAKNAIVEKMFPLAMLVTPNLVEAEVLVGTTLNTDEETAQAALKLLEMGPQAALIKGGHRKDGKAYDCLATAEGVHWLYTDRIETSNTHGTGCTLSTVIACYLAKGEKLIDAVRKAKDFISYSLERNKEVSIGQGNGPVLPMLAPEGYTSYTNYTSVW